MSDRQCPFCNAELPDDVTVCPKCGRDTEVTLRGDSPFASPTTAPDNDPIQPQQRRPYDRTKVKVALVVLAVLFVLGDVALFFYFRRQREEKERIVREELAEKRRQDSIAVVQRQIEEARRDSIRQAQETIAKFVKPSNIFSVVTVYDISEESGDPISFRAYHFTEDPSAMLENRGYSLISHSQKVDYVEGIPIDYHIYVYGINCKWSTADDMPVDTRSPWSCVVLRELYCGQSIRVFFDTPEARDEFYGGIDKSAMSSSDGGYKYLWAFKENGRYELPGYCQEYRGLKKSANNSIEFY